MNFKLQKFIEKSDYDKTGDIDFAEFVHYCVEHEKQLKIIFKDLDVNKDGVLDASEVIAAFSKLGVHLDKQEANKLLKRMKKSGSAEVNFEEWRDYLLLNPANNFVDLMKFWRHAVSII